MNAQSFAALTAVGAAERPGLPGRSRAAQRAGHQVWPGSASHGNLRLPHASRAVGTPCCAASGSSQCGAACPPARPGAGRAGLCSRPGPVRQQPGRALPWRRADWCARLPAEPPRAGLMSLRCTPAGRHAAVRQPQPGSAGPAAPLWQMPCWPAVHTTRAGAALAQGRLAAVQGRPASGRQHWPCAIPAPPRPCSAGTRTTCTRQTAPPGARTRALAPSCPAWRALTAPCSSCPGRRRCPWTPTRACCWRRPRWALHVAPALAGQRSIVEEDPHTLVQSACPCARVQI